MFSWGARWTCFLGAMVTSVIEVDGMVVSLMGCECGGKMDSDLEWAPRLSRTGLA